MAEWEDIKNILLGLLAVGVVLLIVSPGLRHAAAGIFTVADKYGTPKLELANNYMFTAEGVTIEPSAASKCTVVEWDKVTNEPIAWECESGIPENFVTTMKNEGSKMRTFHGATVVCKSGDKDCCGNAKSLASTGAEECALIPGETKGCAAGSYVFTDQYKEYEIHPVADCIYDSTYGCYAAGMTTSVKSCNPAKYITVKIVKP